MRIHQNDIFALILILLSFFIFELMLPEIYNIDCQREITQRGDYRRRQHLPLRHAWQGWDGKRYRYAGQCVHGVSLERYAISL